MYLSPIQLREGQPSLRQAQTCPRDRRACKHTMKAPSSKGRHHRGIREGTARPGAGSSASAELRRQGRSGVRVGGAGGARWTGPGAGTGTEGLAVPFGRPWGAGRPDVRGGRVPGHRRARKPGPRCSRGGASPTLPAAAQTCCPRPASVSLSHSSSGASRPAVCPAPGSVRHPLCYAPAALADVAGRSPDGSLRAPTASSLACELSRSRDLDGFPSAGSTVPARPTGRAQTRWCEQSDHWGSRQKIF